MYFYLLVIALTAMTVLLGYCVMLTMYGKEECVRSKKSVTLENITARDEKHIYLPIERVKSPRLGISLNYDTCSSTLN